MGKIQLEKTAAGIVIRQYDGETLNEVTIPHNPGGDTVYLNTAGDWLRSAHGPGDKIMIGGNELAEFPS